MTEKFVSPRKSRDGGFDAHDILRTAGAARDDVVAAQIDILHSRRKQDMHGFVIRYFDVVRCDDLAGAERF